MGDLGGLIIRMSERGVKWCEKRGCSQENERKMGYMRVYNSSG